MVVAKFGAQGRFDAISEAKYSAAESWQGFCCVEFFTYAHCMSHCSAQLHAIMPLQTEELMSCFVLRVCHLLPPTGLSLMLLHTS